MRPVVFLGPTLDIGSARAELDALYLPPVAQGDVYRAALSRPPAIGIVDGYFQQVPAVWHKEILWTLAQGIDVFGSASMGALRAAELEAFGMEGVGAIFEAYRDGILEDDDDVAVAHGRYDTDFHAVSEPMTNIRATLTAAVGAGVIEPPEAEVLERIGKAIHYPERVYPTILRRAADEGVGATSLDAFKRWLPAGRVDQKRQDAVAMLRAIGDRVANRTASIRKPFFFEQTEAWDRLRRSAGDATPTGGLTAHSLELDDVLDELRVSDSATFERARDSALTRVLALDQAHRQGIDANADALHDAILRFRRHHALLDPRDVELWMENNEVGREGFLALIEQDAMSASVAAALTQRILAALPDELRRMGLFDTLVARARAKRRLLEAHGLWEFPEDGMRRDGGALNDPEPASLGTSVENLERAMAREHAYCRLAEAGTSARGIDRPA
jgi:hypothetical protein